MKRGLRIVTGIIVMLSMVFFSGFVLDSGKAMAEEASISHISSNQQGLIDPRKDITKKSAKEAAQPRETAPKSPARSLISMTSGSDIGIGVNTTVTSKIYPGNVWVLPGVTLQAGTTTTDANITVNGDLYVYGSFRMSRGTLTVNGDIWVFGGFYTSGSAKVYVKPAAPGGFSGYYGGSFVVSYDEGYLGYLEMLGSSNITISYAQYGGFYVQDGAYIKMGSATAKVTVYNDCVFRGESTAGMLEQGTIEVINGDFYQYSVYSDSSFSPGDNFNVILRYDNPRQGNIC